MWRTLLEQVVALIVQEFLKHLGTRLGVPSGAAPLYDPVAVQAAVADTTQALLQ